MQSSHLVSNIGQEGRLEVDRLMSDIHTILQELKFLRVDEKKNYIFENASHSIHDNSIPE